MGFFKHGELAEQISAELISIMHEHNAKIKRGDYKLKREENAGSSYLKGMDLIIGRVMSSKLEYVDLTRLLIKERNIWKNIRDERRERYANGNALIKDVLSSDAFYEGVQYALSIVLEHVVLTLHDEGVVFV